LIWRSGGAGLTLGHVGDIDFKIDDLLLPYMLDVSIYTQIDNPDLIGHIDRIGKIFYRKELE